MLCISSFLTRDTVRVLPISRDKHRLPTSSLCSTSVSNGRPFYPSRLMALNNLLFTKKRYTLLLSLIFVFSPLLVWGYFQRSILYSPVEIFEIRRCLSSLTNLRFLCKFCHASLFRVLLNYGGSREKLLICSCHQ